MRSHFYKFSLFSILAFALACGKSSRIEINGQFHGVADKNIILEELSPTGTRIIDSIHSSTDGDFRFIIDPALENPTFYNVRYEGSYVPLLLQAGESVTIDAVGNIYNNYRVSGSEGSDKMRELSLLTLRQAQGLDSLSRLYENSYDAQHVEAYGRAYGEKYIHLKRDIISFLIKNATSLVAIVPLYQPILGSAFLFDDPSDIIYFRLIADSLKSRYPTSPYVTSLQADLQRVADTYAIDSMVQTTIKGQGINLPEITIKDASGNYQSLSQTRGKVVLLDFTSYNSPDFKMLNQELIKTYNKFNANGFEVFQVCLDLNKAVWIQAVLNARLPWITVNDLQGSSSPALASFNITAIPTRLLIDRQGNIIGKDLYDKNLDEAIAKTI